ncbi:BMP family lipoprotein [Halogranum rubrum]|uniref:Nucleoside-binding protein n=1 Tax=Halogranum salarium B-1 TaxID=1210908 RepID=J3A7B9_9EURY|nr:BMP family protein [Halogranum salarium]EJN61493.1 nucleoside-binding protein [Halogranum salarium B-1]
MDRRTFIKGTGIVGITGLAGCTGGPQDGSGDGGDGGSEETTSGDEGSMNESTTESSGEGSASADINVGMVYALGGLGDKSFNDAAQTGVKQAKEELGITYNEAQPSSAEEFPQFQRQFAQGDEYDLVCCIGFAQQSALKNTAPNFPDQKFMLVDSTVEQDNVANYLFKEEQGSFQVGHLAGLLTSQEFAAGGGETSPDQKTIGFVGGVDAPLIRKFQAGYEAGAAHADEEVEVLTAYTGSFSDPQAGKEAALSMYDQGADIVYHAAGASGVGVFQAAQEKGGFAIGVDSDQSKAEPDYADIILASMVKRVDTAVFESIQNVANDEFEGGSTVTLGLEQEGVACVYGAEIGSDIPSGVKSEVDASAEAIIGGDISVPTSTQ